MLKTDIIWPDSRRFKSRSEWEPAGFFSECLCNSNSFDLMLGFFSSSAVSVLSDGFAAFLYNGGTMRLIINDILTEDDRDAVIRGADGSLLPAFDLSNLESLKETLSERGRHFFDCIAWLIRNGRIEICVITPKGGEGVAHTKCGVFCDGLSKVGFDGSVNFSRTAFIDNKESLTACCSWDNAIERAKIIDIEEEFERTFSGGDDTVIYVDPSAIRTRLSEGFPDKDIRTLLEEEYDIMSGTDRLGMPLSVQAALKRASEKVGAAIRRIRERETARATVQETPADPTLPRFPYPSGPRQYQQDAFDAWRNNYQRGLFAMATGTGKTITSLNCLYEIYKRKGYYKAVILVPTVTLVDQWEAECRKFNFTGIVKVCSANHRWESQVNTFHMLESMESPSSPVSYIIICTYASYLKTKVFTSLNGFSRSQVLFIADECHNMGAAGIRRKMDIIPYSRRIGLSATPDRQFDEAGNAVLLDFFGASRRYTFEYDMDTAIHGDPPALCRYDYYPHVVRLTETEMDEYMKISVKLARLFNYDRNAFEGADSVLKLLLLKRKSIIHKAENKLEVFRSIIEDRLAEKGDLKYMLVYVPEGNVVDEFADEVFSESDTLQDDPDTVHLIDRYTAVIRDAGKDVTVRQFTGGTKDRDTILEDFAAGRLEVLTSMKCLDEGVDVPRSELAVFCASTGNPRQFIQRRGRILRMHPDKRKAVIHDLVVVPEVVEGAESYEMERSLMASELRRVKNFALLSENAGATLDELDRILEHYNLSIFD